MPPNKIIQRGLLLNKFILWLCYLFFAGFAIIVIHWHFDPLAYQKVDVTQSFKVGYGVNEFQLLLGNQPLAQDAIFMSELSHLMIYWLLIRAAIFFIITIIILRQVEHILQSIKNAKTFYSNNISHFQKIAKWSLVAFPISCINFYLFDGHWHFEFGLVLAPLIIAVASLIMAEIFREGKEISEDQKMIV